MLLNHRPLIILVFRVREARPDDAEEMDGDRDGGRE